MVQSSAQPGRLPARPAAGHKGDFGTVMVVGGCATGNEGGAVMVGGPAFSALAALRSGAGLAVLAVPAPLMAAGLTIAPSATGLALPVDDAGALRSSAVAEMLDNHRPRASCIVIGPGLGCDTAQQQVVIRLCAQREIPLVVDADALNCLAAAPDFARDLAAPIIITPHPGEYRRLAGALGIDADPVDVAARPAAAERLAQRLGCIVVLKGHRTVITDGQQTAVNETGNVALATAGSGDVLAGVIGGFVAQFLDPMAGMLAALGAGKVKGGAAPAGFSLLDCARLATHVHGLAADLWAECHGTAGMLATDLIEALPDALAKLRAE